MNSQEGALENDNCALKSRSNPSVFKTKGNTFKDLGNYTEALKNYDHYVALKPNDAETLANRGWVLDKLKRYEEAVESYSRSLALTKHYWTLDAPTFNNRANTLKSLGAYEGALFDYDVYLDIKPNDAEAQANRGWVANQLKDYQKALISYNRSLEVRPNHLPTLHNRLEVFKNLGRFAEAMSDCKLCLEIDPHYAPALANRPKILRGLASKGNKKEKMHFFFKVYAKTIGTLHYIIVKPILYMVSYLTIPIRKTKNVPFLSENTSVPNGHQAAKAEASFSQNIRDSILESSSETPSM